MRTTCVVPSSSRRLWCSQVRNVVLFDFPLNTTEYLHRVGASRPVGHHIRPNACPHHALSTGRTARAASKGTATSLITKRDRVLARAIMVRPTRSHAFTPTRLHAGTMLMHLAFCTQEASKDGTVFEDLSSDRRVNVQQACVVVGAARDHCTSVLTQRVAGRACGLAIVCHSRARAAPGRAPVVPRSRPRLGSRQAAAPTRPAKPFEAVRIPDRGGYIPQGVVGGTSRTKARGSRAPSKQPSDAGSASSGGTTPVRSTPRSVAVGATQRTGQKAAKRRGADGMVGVRIKRG